MRFREVVEGLIGKLVTTLIYQVGPLRTTSDKQAHAVHLMCLALINVQIRAFLIECSKYWDEKMQIDYFAHCLIYQTWKLITSFFFLARLKGICKLWKSLKNTGHVCRREPSDLTPLLMRPLESCLNADIKGELWDSVDLGYSLKVTTELVLCFACSFSALSYSLMVAAGNIASVKKCLHLCFSVHMQP